MPVSYAGRKLGTVFPPEGGARDGGRPAHGGPAHPAVLVLSPLLPQADTINARPTARDAGVKSHFRVCLRFKVFTSQAGFIRGKQALKAEALPRAVHSY